MGSHSLIFPVIPEKAIANHSNGLLTINIPYKNACLGGV